MTVMKRLGFAKVDSDAQRVAWYFIFLKHRQRERAWLVFFVTIFIALCWALLGTVWP